MTRASETNEKLGPTVQCRLTSTEYREFKKLARSIGHSQLLRILITQAIAKAKNGGLQIDLTVHRATPYAENQETTRGNHDIQLSEAIA